MLVIFLLCDRRNYCSVTVNPHQNQIPIGLGKTLHQMLIRYPQRDMKFFLFNQETALILQIADIFHT